MSANSTGDDANDLASIEGKDFDRDFIFTGKIGTSGSAQVFKAVQAKTSFKSTPYVVKRIRSLSLKELLSRGFYREASILHELDHPNVIQIYKYYRNWWGHSYMVLECMAGGQLFDAIVTKESYSEKNVKDLCKVLVDAIKHCHDRNIAHRDLNPSNILLTSRGDIKIVDFRMARNVGGGPITDQSRNGGFLAPEILKGKPHGKPVDMWSLGLIIYTLLAGEHPFNEPTSAAKFFNRVTAGSFEFPGGEKTAISDNAKDFVFKLLTVEPSERLTAEEAIAHPWLLGMDKNLAERDLSRNLQSIKRSLSKRKLRSSVKTVMAAMKMFSFLPSGKFSSEFEVGKLLGRGKYGEVYQATKTGDEKAQIYAVKRISKSKLSEVAKKRTAEEANIMRSLDHPNMLRIHHFYEDDAEYFYMVLDFMAGGMLFDRVVQKIVYTEEEARNLSRILLGAIKYLHNMDVVHRDIKAENVLLSSETDDTSITLADFGFARKLRGRKTNYDCGSAEYKAPEILKGEYYGTSVDMWSIGVIIFVLLTGVYPFGSGNDQGIIRLSRRIKNGYDLQFHELILDGYNVVLDSTIFAGVRGGASKEAKDLVRRLLTKDPDQRITASEAVDHPWFFTEGKALSIRNLGSSQEKLRKYNAKAKLRAMFQTYLGGNDQERTAKVRTATTRDGGTEASSSYIIDTEGY